MSDLRIFLSMPDQAIPTTGISQHLETVRSTLADHIASNGDRLASCELEHVICRPYSTVTFLAVRTGTECKRLVAKTTVNHSHNKRIVERENQALLEYEVLERLYASFQELEGCSVPRPLVVMPEIDTYVMEFVEGGVLADYSKHTRYFALRGSFESLQRHYSLCGRWLKHFQQTTGTYEGDVRAIEPVVQRCGELLKRLVKENPGRRWGSLAGRVMNDLERELKLLGDDAVPLSGRHGDFGPWNVLASDKGITVIDFFGYRDEPVPLDVLRMLVYLDDEKRCLTNSAKRIALLRERFLEGYGPLPPVPAPLAIICETQQRLVGLVDAHRIRKTGRVHQRVAAHFSIKAHVGWLTERAKQEPLWPGL